MLVLSRRTNETIVINQDIRVTVVESRSHRVRLGIQAPAGLRVDRLEIHERLCRSGDHCCQHV